ncbi:MAG: hypothetical protein G01um101430_242 [Parcubacteria group bacterium Gr01-1014_30]|nr:MAG: hypothetical protein G01um101430_242 [Parcubacteria group bacterium Gr01-1014_30]
MFGKAFKKIKVTFIPCRENEYRPKLLTGRFLIYYVVFLLLAKFVIVPFFLYFPKSSFFADLTKTQLIEFTNAARHDLGLSPVRENEVLSEAAFLKAKDMLQKSYFAHWSPEGISPWHWFAQSGYNWRLAGENLAIGFVDSEQVHSAWMSSLKHRDNILNGEFREVGISVLTGNFQGKETSLVVQLFGTQQVQAAPTAQSKEAIFLPALPPNLVGGPEQKPADKEESLVPKEQGQVLFAAPPPQLERTFAFFFFNFMASDYYGFVQKIIYWSFGLIMLSLLLTVFYDIFIYKRFEIQHKDAVLKAVIFGSLWFALLFLDKLLIIKLIAYEFQVD